VLRIEVIVHSVKALRRGKRLEKPSIVLSELQRMLIDFLNVVQAAHLASLDAGALDALPQPTQRGAQRLAGVDIQKPRMRAAMAAVLASAPKPGGFTVGDVAERTRVLLGPGVFTYTSRHAAYDLRKLRGKALVERVRTTRRYQPQPQASARWRRSSSYAKRSSSPSWRVRTDQAGAAPQTHPPLDVHYENLQRELRRTFENAGLGRVISRRSVHHVGLEHAVSA
jgi:hypothetical protein